MNDLHSVSGPYPMLDVPITRHDLFVDLDGDRPLDEAQVVEERPDREVVGHVARLPVDRHLHARKRRSSFSSALLGARPPEAQCLEDCVG